MPTRTSTSSTTCSALARWGVLHLEALHQAYSVLHRVSMRNQLAIASQCDRRNLAIGPVASAADWRARGRELCVGAHPLQIAFPVLDGDVFLGLRYEATAFVLAQTTGPNWAPLSAGAWETARVVSALRLVRIGFHAERGTSYRHGRFFAIAPDHPLPSLELLRLAIAYMLEEDRADDDPCLTDDIATVAAALVAGALDLDGAATLGALALEILDRNPLDEPAAFRALVAADRAIAVGRVAGVRPARRGATPSPADRLAPVRRVHTHPAPSVAPQRKDPAHVRLHS